MPTPELVALCLATSLASFFLPPPLPLVVAASMCMVLFRYELSEEEQDLNLGPEERLESFVYVGEEPVREAVQYQPVQRKPKVTVTPAIVASSLSAGEERVREALSHKQLEMVTRLIKKLSSDPNFRPVHPSHVANLVNARRFLHARSWNETVAEDLWRKAVVWRENYGMTERRNRLNRLRELGPGIDPAFDFCEKNWFIFKTGPCKYDVHHAVTRAGTADPHGIVRELGGNVDIFVERAVEAIEVCVEEAIEKDVFDRGIVEIADLREFKHVPHYFSRAYNSITGFKILAGIMDGVYPERVRRVVLLGAPSVFAALWNLIQPLIPKETKKKIAMLGPNQENKWMAALCEEMPLESIPQYIGGKMSNDNVLEGGIVPKNSYPIFLKEFEQQHYDIGLIADVQHANADDGYNFARTRIRKYRGALEGLERACEDWKLNQVRMVLQLGDLIDGVAKRVNDSEEAVKRCYALLENAGFGQSTYHVVGNHDLYNFNRDYSGMHNVSCQYRDIDLPNVPFTLLILDAYEISVIGYPETDERYSEASEILLKNNPNDYRTGADWLKGLVGLQRRFVPYNGAVSKKQLLWLEEKLKKSIKDERYVIIVCHVPLQPGSGSSSCLLWNYVEVTDLLKKYATSKFDGKAGVALALAGHDHKGGYAIDEAGIHYVTLAAPLEAPDCLAHGILRLGQRGMVLRGSGMVPTMDLVIHKDQASADRAREAYAKEKVGIFHAACKADNKFKHITLDVCRRVWTEYGGTWDALPLGEWPAQYADGG